jgi:tRNA threonylcarbamoyladenosine biosynthesis protein TsaE
MPKRSLAAAVPQVLVARTVRATRGFAKRLARELRGGAVLALVGDLGAGKTSFVQGLAQGLAIFDQSQVLSPTYTLVNEYPGPRLTLVHVDCYRLSGTEAAHALGLEEQIGRPDSVTAVEWADLLPELIPEGSLWVSFASTDEGGRKLTISRNPPSMPKST